MDAREGRDMADDVELAVLTAMFDARAEHADELAGVLARYVVLTRNEPGCRNVDLLTSATESGQFLVIEKWDSPELARAHLDTELMTDMARSVVPLLAGKPRIDLLDTISAHDLM
jgi:quinol monooxygenase YgiN